MIIRVEILDNVRREAADLKSDRHRIDDPLRTSPKLMEFIEETFNQAFRSQLGMGISGFTQADKEEVVLLSDESSPDGAVEDLLSLYVDVCNMWPDVLNQAYGGTTADFLEFRTELVPSILDSLAQLAEVRDDRDLHPAVLATRRDYGDAIAAAREAIGT